MVYNAYQGKYIIVIYALGLAHKKFDVWNQVARQSKFSFVLLFFFSIYGST